MKMVLIGFQRAGKTTVGRRLAEQWKIPFFDLDAQILGLLGGASIQSTFLELGEDRFRKVEEEVAATLLNHDQYILAFGGGALAPLQRIPQDARVLYLYQSFDLLCRRILNGPLPAWIDSSRPLLSLQEKWGQRHPLFTRYATEIVSLGGV